MSDDSHWNDERPKRQVRSMSEVLRESLREVGIELEAAKPKAPACAPAAPAEPDRDAIRALLEPLGCPEWAIRSCPSVEAALTYKPKEIPCPPK